MNTTKNDYRILHEFMKSEATNEMKSRTIKYIKKKTGLSDSKVRKTIKKFRKIGYINQGAWLGNSKTYFITESGINKINELF